MAASKVDRKLRRKLMQVSQRFPSSKFTASDTPSIYVFIGNGGLESGVSSDLLHCVLHATLKQLNKTIIHSKPSLDFSVVEFSDISNAEMAILKLNGQCVQELVCKLSLNYLAPQSLMKGPPLHLLMSHLTEIPLVCLELQGAPESGDESTLPPGCFLLENFVTDEEEIMLLKLFSVDFAKTSKSLECCIEWERNMRKGSDLDFSSSSATTCAKPVDFALTSSTDSSEKALPSTYTQLKLRTVHHYGYEFLYGSNTVDPNAPLPGGLPSDIEFLLQRLIATGLVMHCPDQLTVNEYHPGAGIPPHIDTHSAFKDGISSITLGSQVVMQFQHPSGRKVDILLTRKSLLVMTGEARYVWTHGIPARKSDIVSSSTPGAEFLGLNRKPLLNHIVADRYIRVSLTLRKIHCAPCECGSCDNSSSDNL